MPDNIKALIVVLVLAAPAFYISRQLAASVITPREFAVWRNVWIAVTVAGFLCSDYFVFAGIMAIICLYTLATRSASVGLFMVLILAVPLSRIEIPGFGLVNLLFEINNGRLLAIIFLLPIIFTTGKMSQRNGGNYALPDRLVIGYVLLLIALEIQRSEVTQFLRSALLLALDVLIPYFAFSRAVTTVADLRRVSLAVVIAVLPLSLIGIFETAKGWLLYSIIVVNWSDLGVFVSPKG